METQTMTKSRNRNIASRQQTPPPQVATSRPIEAYRPPTSGLLSLLPASWVPYGELMRLHKPAGYFAFYFPHLIGLLLAQAVSPPSQPRSLHQQLTIHVCLLAGNLFLRGAACTWNDTLDAPYDRQVARCRSRPIARNAVSRVAGILFTAAQTALWIALGLAPLGHECWAPAALLAASQAVYPLFKRFTNYPQLWLGFSFGCGLGVGAGAGGIDIEDMLIRLVRDASHGPPGDMATLGAWDRRVLGAMVCLYAAGVLNTLIYDTIYGHQDLADDLKAGVKSLAVAWRDDTKRNCVMLAVVEVVMLAAAGFAAGLGSGYYASAVGGSALVLGRMLYWVRLDDPALCMQCFNWLIYGTGLTLALGLLAAGVGH